MDLLNLTTFRSELSHSDDLTRRRPLPTRANPENDAKDLTLDFFRIIQIFVALFGVGGNSLVLLILSKTKVVMKNQTNFLIGNQSAADLFSSFQLILFQVEYFTGWPSPVPGSAWSRLYCFFWEARLLLFGSYAVSTFNLTILSIERYFAVVHPNIYMAKIRRRFFSFMGLGTWFLGPAMQIIFVASHVYYKDHTCQFKQGTPFIGVVIFLWDYFIPVCIMTFCFVKIDSTFRSLNKVQNDWRADNSTTGVSTVDGEIVVMATNIPYANRFPSEPQGPQTGRSHSLQRRNATITLFIVYIAYIICWTPNQFGFLQYNLGGALDWDGLFYRVELILASSNTFINVLIYALRFKTFQRGLKDLIPRW